MEKGTKNIVTSIVEEDKRPYPKLDPTIIDPQ